MPNDFGGVETTSAAIEALSADLPLEAGEQVPQAAPPEPAQVPVVDPAVQQQPVVNDLDSLPAPDLSSLSPEARAAADAAIKGFQATFTQKTQAIAPIRQLAEQVGGAEKLQQIADFYQRLDSDRDFAAQVRDQLNTALGEGTPAPQTPTPQVETPTGLDLDDLPPDIAKAYRDMQEMQAGIQQTLQQQEQQRYEAEVLAQYTRDEAAILTANPSYGKADIEAIYNLAYANGGDLNQAHAYYQQVEQQMLTRYLAGKQANPSPTIPASTQRGDVPVETKDLDIKTVRQGAIEALRNDPNSSWA